MGPGPPPSLPAQDWPLWNACCTPVLELGSGGGRRGREAGSPHLVGGAARCWGAWGALVEYLSLKEAGAGLRPRGWDPAVGAGVGVCRRMVRGQWRGPGVFQSSLWKRLLRIPWTESRSNQSILKEINCEYPLEGLMLKLKLQYFGHLMQRSNSLEKTVMLGKIEGKRRRGQQRIGWLDGITDSKDVSLRKLRR